MTWDSSAIEARNYCGRVINSSPIFLMGFIGAVIPSIYIRYKIAEFLVFKINHLRARLRNKTVLRARITRLEACGMATFHALICGIVFAVPVDRDSRLRTDLEAIMMVQAILVFFSSIWMIGFYNSLIGNKFALGYRKKVSVSLNRDSMSDE